uniref:transcription elongation factor 1 homolog n=1 Tax=Jaculus jaculus TaxID=51337 RepID=UPI001E1B1832|nr:transcription elongation factor 1 homolog [Jaculus jaculus]
MHLPPRGPEKSNRKPPPKKKMTDTLETRFTCPFCTHEKSRDVKMDRACNTGVVSWTRCLVEFQTPSRICHSDWMNACEAAHQ